MENIQLRCRAHNGYEAERHFGRWGPVAAREDSAVYVTRDSTISMAPMGGVRAVNSFRNEFEPGPRNLPPRSGTSSAGDHRANGSGECTRVWMGWHFRPSMIL